MNVNTDDAAKILGVSRRHVRRLIDTGKLVAHKPDGKDWLITETSLKNYQARTKKVGAALDKFANEYGTDFIITGPKEVKSLEEDGHPIKGKFIPDDEYVVSLIDEKASLAKDRIEILPRLKPTNYATIDALYKEFRECFVLGVDGAAITLAIILLELAMKQAILVVKKKDNSQASWSSVESDSFRETVEKLASLGIIDEAGCEKRQLLDFNSEVRNHYIHYKIKTLIKQAQVSISELPAINIKTGEVRVLRDVAVKDQPFLWFAAKRRLDKDAVLTISRFCINWVDKLLG